MARTCSASTVAACSGVVGSVMVADGSCAVRTVCLREGGSGLNESVASVSGVVVVGRACSAFLRVLVALSRFFAWFGLSVRCVSFPRGD